MDIRPAEGARWLEEHGGRYHLYRIYDNEWWHFEYRPENGGQAPIRLPDPGAAATSNEPDKIGGLHRSRTPSDSGVRRVAA
jgi:hypothetical protein